MKLEVGLIFGYLNKHEQMCIAVYTVNHVWPRGALGHRLAAVVFRFGAEGS